MDKEKKLKLQISFAAIALGLLLIALLYTIINYSNLWLALAGFGILTLADIFWIVNSVLSVMAIREAKRAEQYESIFKSEKASYLMLKKYSEEITERLQHLEKMINSPAAEIIKTQKSIAKVIISRERENAEALMNANDMLTEQLEALEKRMENSYSTMETKYEKISATNKDQIIAKQQEFIVALKDMELRLTSVMGQRLAAPVMQAPVMQAPVMQTAPTPVPVMAEPVMEEPAPAVEPVIEEPVVEEPAAAAEPVIEEPVVEEPAAAAEPVIEESVVEEPAAAAVPVIEESVVEEPTPEPEPVIEESVVEEPTPEPEPVIEEPVIEEPVAEEAAPAPEMDDPNKKLSPDEIAAMFAAAEAADAPAEEPAAEPEPVAAEAPAAPEMDDPNKMMSPDDIAALISSMGAEPIPEPMTGEEEEAPAAEAPAEDTPPMPDLSDPNKKMSPDEIAALFANMG
ncbi:hypothetical protein [Agathobacter ruminis]|uniref:hypothetical protein n=1 Tax=Agathobacter ruminis TaxID=1712665 RepID=UPI00166F7CBD|nr:hypothetical protein [Agathobacter ruminis]MDC7302326.1 hypothetical protein [Agathobacter ruminis]